MSATLSLSRTHGASFARAGEGLNDCHVRLPPTPLPADGARGEMVSGWSSDGSSAR